MTQTILPKAAVPLSRIDKRGQEDTNLTRSFEFLTEWGSRMWKSKNMNWLLVALVVTGGYAAIAIWILGWSNVSAFITGNSGQLNAIGDFTAGMFAPIAVIWLVAAVLTQRQELDEARNQAEAAQGQFKTNQKVIDEQLALIKSQNAMLQLQNQQSVENAERAYRLSLFDKRMAVYQKFTDIGERQKYGTINDHHDVYWELLNLANEAAFVFDKSIADWLNEIAGQIHEFTEYHYDNPLETTLDEYGNTHKTEAENNNEIESVRMSYINWLGEQFLPETRTERFLPYMYVSDKQPISG